MPNLILFENIIFKKLNSNRNRHKYWQADAINFKFFPDYDLGYQGL